MEIERNVYLIYYKGEILDEVVAVSEEEALYQYGGHLVSSDVKAVKN